MTVRKKTTQCDNACKKPLLVTHPELAAQWHPTKNSSLTPHDVGIPKAKKIWWLLPYDDPKTGKHFDFEWEDTLSHRLSGRGCPYLSGQKVWVGFNDFASAFPELVQQWHPTKNGDLTPYNVTASSGRKIWWYLPYDDPRTGKHFDFEWETAVSHRADGQGCPYLSGKYFKGFNDLAAVHPELVKEWHPTKNGNLKPDMITFTYREKVWWFLSYDDPKTGKHFDFEWQESPACRDRGYQCPFLSGRQVWRGFNDLATTHPELATQWHPAKNGDLTPFDITAGCNKKVWWLLPYDDPKTGKHFDYEWEACVCHRSKGSGCPFLSNHKFREGINDLATTHPELAAQWHPTKNGNLKPTMIGAGSSEKVWWYLPYDDPATGKHFDFEWQAAVNKRRRTGNCPFISGKRVWPGYNDLASIHPELAVQWHPTKNTHLTPDKVTAGSSKKVWWQCEQGHIWQSTVDSRSAGKKCPFCAFSKNKQHIIKILRSYSIPFKVDYEIKDSSFDEPLVFDIAVFAKNKELAFVVDCNNGEFYKDKNFIKRKYCSEHRISFTNIPDGSSKNVVNVIFKKLFCLDALNVKYFKQKHKSTRHYNRRKEPLSVTHPELAAQWHPTKNGSLTPNHITAGSGKRVWWYLPYDDPKTGKHFDFEWDAVVGTRVQRPGCPFISGQRVWQGYNDLATTHPEVAKQWHPTKNGKLTPYDFVAGSTRSKVWWLMPYDDPETGKHFDFEWSTTVEERTRSGYCCPFLSGGKIWTGFNDLATKYPKLAAQWHPTKNGKLTPQNVGVNFQEKIWWLFPYDDPETGKHFDFEWDALIGVRTQTPGCPFLSGRRVWKGFNDLVTKRPDIATQWHPSKNGNLKPEDVSVGCGQRVWWLLPYDDPVTGKHFDFEWAVTVSHRTSGLGCPFLSNQKLWKGFNDLATLRPDIAAEWHPTKNGNLTPSDVMVASNRKVWWCLPYDDPKTGKHFDFEWESTVAHRTDGRNCPYLTGKKVYRGFNDLATVNPDIAAQWHPTKNGKLTPHDVTASSDKRVWWSLPYDDPKTGKHFDFEWDATVAHRNITPGCPYITSHRIYRGFNDLATRYPELAAQWHPTKNGKLKPCDIMPSCNKKIWWYLPYDDPKTGKHFDFEWFVSPNSRMSENGCPYLSGKKVFKGFNDFATIYPSLVSYWHPTKNGKLTPYNITSNSNRQIYWKGDCGHEWVRSPNQIRDIIGCPVCAASFNEQRISRLLDKYSIDYVPEYKFGDCKHKGLLRFDFAIFNNANELQFLIEYDGEQHYKPIRFRYDENVLKNFEGTQLRDGIKNQYCRDNNISLIRIPYWDADNIEKIILKKLFRCGLLHTAHLNSLKLSA